MYSNAESNPHCSRNGDQLLTNKSLVKENNWYNSTTSALLIYQQPPHIHEAKNLPSNGNNCILYSMLYERDGYIDHHARIHIILIVLICEQNKGRRCLNAKSICYD